MLTWERVNGLVGESNGRSVSPASYPTRARYAESDRVIAAEMCARTISPAARVAFVRRTLTSQKAEPQNHSPNAWRSLAPSNHAPLSAVPPGNVETHVAGFPEAWSLHVDYGGFGELAGSIRCVGTTRFIIDEMTPWTQNTLLFICNCFYTTFLFH
jgi:hypothetical protein